MSRHIQDPGQHPGSDPDRPRPPAEAWRTSRLGPHPGGGDLVLAVADLHNHTLMSDGSGDPETAFDQMRRAGLHAAALTDHSSIPRHAIGSLRAQDYPDASALATARTAPRSIDDEEWRRAGEIADRHDVPDEFAALRGFEWTEPWLGHVNVWFSDTYVPVTSPGSLTDLFAFLEHEEPEALFGYNHPGREPGDLEGFRRPPGPIRQRMVALELFNRRDDYLFVAGRATVSPLVDCLDAGWRPALIGCSDEHGRDYGLEGKGRTGLWVDRVSRDGVRGALRERRAFATREAGLRLDARLDGVPGGGRLGARPGAEAELEVDLAAPGHDGREVVLQVLTGRDGDPAVLAEAPAVCGEVTRTSVPVPGGAGWLVLRVADPARPYALGSVRSSAPPGHPCDCWALAYASPWHLDPRHLDPRQLDPRQLDPPAAG